MEGAGPITFSGDFAAEAEVGLLADLNDSGTRRFCCVRVSVTRSL